MRHVIDIDQDGPLKDQNDSVASFLAQLISPDATEEPTLGYMQIQGMKIKNKGFPMDMYHERLDPQQAHNGPQRDALIKAGFSTTYKRREWPRAVHRRNMAEQFEEFDYVESREVRDEAHFQQLKRAKPLKGSEPIGDWAFNVAEVAPMPVTDESDPQLLISELRGRLAERRGDELEEGELVGVGTEPKRRGRPPLNRS